MFHGTHSLGVCVFLLLHSWRKTSACDRSAVEGGFWLNEWNDTRPPPWISSDWSVTWQLFDTKKFVKHCEHAVERRWKNGAASCSSQKKQCAAGDDRMIKEASFGIIQEHHPANLWTCNVCGHRIFRVEKLMQTMMVNQWVQSINTNMHQTYGTLYPFLKLDWTWRKSIIIMRTQKCTKESMIHGCTSKSCLSTYHTPQIQIKVSHINMRTNILSCSE